MASTEIMKMISEKNMKKEAFKDSERCRVKVINLVTYIITVVDTRLCFQLHQSGICRIALSEFQQAEVGSQYLNPHPPHPQSPSCQPGSPSSPENPEKPFCHEGVQVDRPGSWGGITVTLHPKSSQYTS